MRGHLSPPQIALLVTGLLQDVCVPTVFLDNATFVGTALSAHSIGFLGIPYSKSPVGDLRFRTPEPHTPYTGIVNATSFGPACIQQHPADLVWMTVKIVGRVLPSGKGIQSSRTGLTLNVVVPAEVERGGLPVVFWIHGGGFEVGSSSQRPGDVIVDRSVDIGTPVVHVSINYREFAEELHIVMGFPAGKETREAGIGNLGLRDQRLALRWVRKYIAAFGGDPAKVMIWGQSAGAMSVASQMVTNNGDTESLFRAAWMHSGATYPGGEVEGGALRGTQGIRPGFPDTTLGQRYFDTFVKAAGCGDALGSPKVFDCLREVSLDNVREAIQSTPDYFQYQSLALAWSPRADGSFLVAPGHELLMQGKIADISLVSGVTDDEGTIFALTNSNITTNAQLEEYLLEYFAPGDREAVSILLDAYPTDPAFGAPFDTGSQNTMTPQFKRIAALGGGLDLSGKQHVYSFLSKRVKWAEYLGAHHSSDLMNVFGPGDMTDYLIHFATTLDPNSAIEHEPHARALLHWPRYIPSSRQLLTFLDGDVPLAVQGDSFRGGSMQKMTEFIVKNPLP
ncbi:carotenoid ester lipase precursor [Vararia minispora EC-137]|uniref:Carotenoid ester lipase n=1 Tax=Vararia minispora EC-137 TaxID=1314806 RepID=A0ACB8Q8S1_9AGAM|nr:carotenoid ester lipase precursor [Vararia minispora EC-137]